MATRTVETCLDRLSLFKDPTMRARQLDSMQLELRDQRDEVVASMRQAGWNGITLGTLCIVIGGAGNTVVGAATFNPFQALLGA